MIIKLIKKNLTFFITYMDTTQHPLVRAINNTTVMDGPYRLTTRKTAKDRVKGYHYYYYTVKGNFELRWWTGYQLINKEKKGARDREYHQKNKERCKLKKREWYEKNKEKFIQYSTDYHLKNKERFYQQQKKYRQKNKEKIAENNQHYYQKNKKRYNCTLCKLISSKLRFVSKENKKVRMCADCFYHTYPDEKKVPTRYKRKQHYIHEKLKETYGEDFFTYDRRIECGCSRKIPDWFCDCFQFVLNIECDEDQHKRNEASCENKRLMELFLDCANRPFVCLRFNPDKYINTKGEKVKGCFSFDTKNTLIVDQQEFERRWDILEERINHFLEYGAEKEIELEKLFYDGWD